MNSSGAHPVAASCASTARPSARATGTSSRPSSRPTRRGTSRAFRARSTARRPCRACAPRSTTTRPQRGRRGARRDRGAHERPSTPASRRGGPHRAPRRSRAQENSDVDSPVLPSYSIPKALICDRLASAIVRSDPTGWNMPANRTGSPVSTPKGTMSSISKSIASPTRTPWRRPSSVSSIRARSTPSTSPTNGRERPPSDRRAARRRPWPACPPARRSPARR